MPPFTLNELKPKRWFHNKDGKLVLAQTPNAPLVLWFVSMLTVRFAQLPQNWEWFVDLLAFGSIFTWAWMEIFDGDNLFRRVLGIMVMTAAFLARSQNL